eukprot:scaffold87140_cov67-Phaeocystis_antarctica.AAC.2
MGRWGASASSPHSSRTPSCSVPSSPVCHRRTQPSAPAETSVRGHAHSAYTVPSCARVVVPSGRVIAPPSVQE